MKRTINIEYEEGKKLLKKYVEKMKRQRRLIKRLIRKYDNSIFDTEPELEYFNRSAAIKFLRTWEIISTELNPKDRNLIYAIEACNQNYKKMLTLFNGSSNNGYKNIATLHVLVCNARKEVKRIYNEKYGNNN